MAGRTHGALLVLVALVFGQSVTGSHFRGGSIFLTVSGLPPADAMVTVLTRQAFGDGTCSGTNSYTHTATSISGDAFTTSFSISANCLAGTNIFEGTTTIAVPAGVGLLRVEFTGSSWGDAFGGGSWLIFSEIDLTGPRTDTGQYNNGPQTLEPLNLAALPNCPFIRIPVYDPDSIDVVQCRLAVGDECGSTCVFNAGLQGTIQEDCRITFGTGSTTGGPYAVNLVYEDFAFGAGPPLSITLNQLFLTVADKPATLVHVSVDPTMEHIYVPATAVFNPVFTIDFNINIIKPNAIQASFTFVLRASGTILHTVTSNTAAGDAQLTYLGSSIQVRPTYNFAPHVGAQISVLMEEAVAYSASCEEKTVAITSADDWWVAIDDVNECLAMPPCGGYLCENLPGTYACECPPGQKWNTMTTACVVISCGEPGPLTAATKVGSSYDYGDTVSYSCNLGYTRTSGADGDIVITCQDDGTWTGFDACSMVNCGPPPVVDFGTTTDTDYNYLDEVTYTCMAGFEPADGGSDVTLMCGADGQWSGYMPCQDINECGTSPCGLGVCWNTLGSFLCFCLPGQLPDTNGLCQVISCGEPAPLTAATQVGSSYDYGDTVSYSCNLGYTRTSGADGDIVITCQDDGTWTGFDTCSVVNCGPPPVVDFGTTTDADYNYLDEVTYTCMAGFEPADGGSDVTLTCGADGQWSGYMPCQDINECGTSPCGLGVCWNTFGSFLCSCLPNQRPDINGVCQAIECRDPGDIPNALRHGSGQSYTNTVYYSCKPGYTRASGIHGNIQIICGSLGDWHGLDTCVLVTCDVPAALPNSVLTYSRTDYGAVAVYTCHRGYVRKTGPPGPFTVTCGPEGAWEGWDTCTVVTCVDPGPVAFASRPNMMYTYTYSSTVTYTCDAGFTTPVGHPDTITITCQQDGNWTSRTLCEDVNECRVLQNPCKDILLQSSNGSPLDNICINTLGSYICNLQIAFSSSCELNNLFSWCVNGGECVMEDGTPTCRCPSGFEGPQCEIDRSRPRLTLTLAAVGLTLAGLLALTLGLCTLGTCIYCRRNPAPQPVQNGSVVPLRRMQFRALWFRRPQKENPYSTRAFY